MQRSLFAAKLWRVLTVLGVCVLLTLLAVLLALTNMLPIVIALSAIGLVLSHVIRIGIAEYRREAA